MHEARGITMPRFCQACEDGEHAYCGMQTWCECECDPENIFDYFDPCYEMEWPEESEFPDDDDDD